MLFGECDHPDDSVINLKNASHMITRMYWDGDSVLGTVKVLKTPSGDILRGLYESGVLFGFSSRAMITSRKSRRVWKFYPGSSRRLTTYLF